jgi:hypothetical protein
MLLIPTLVAFGFFIFGGKKVTLWEFFGQMVVQAIFMSLIVFGMSRMNTSDVEIISGVVTNKIKDRVSCRHSYSCNCREICSGSGNNRSCYTHCDTCYEHSYDIDWDVHTTIGTFSIDTIDRQGLQEPPRWTAVRIGEPVATTHWYENYIKGSPDSLFRHQGLVEKYAKVLPKYPSNVYDYWHVDRLVTVGVSLPDAKLWNQELQRINGFIGPRKKANIVVVVVKNQPSDYFKALEQHWIGSKKNDIVAVISVDDSYNVQWAETMAWTKDKMVEVVVSDHIRRIGKLDREQILDNIAKSVDAYYVRKPMKEFEYLKSSVTPTFGQWMFAMVFGFILSVGLGIFMIKNDIDDEDRHRKVWY